MKKQRALPIVQSEKVKERYSNKISLFNLYDDPKLTRENAKYIIKEVNKLLINVQSELAQTMFLKKLYSLKMNDKQFVAACEYAFNEKTYGDKDLMNHITSFDKTIPIFTWKGVLKLVHEEIIERTKEMKKVQFINSNRIVYIYEKDFIKELMIAIEPEPVDLNRLRLQCPPINKDFKVPSWRDNIK